MTIMQAVMADMPGTARQKLHDAFFRTKMQSFIIFPLQAYPKSGIMIVYEVRRAGF
jgi:hypothetical protein